MMHLDRKIGLQNRHKMWQQTNIPQSLGFFSSRVSRQVSLSSFHVRQSEKPLAMTRNAKYEMRFVTRIFSWASSQVPLLLSQRLPNNESAWLNNIAYNLQWSGLRKMDYDVGKRQNVTGAAPQQEMFSSKFCRYCWNKELRTARRTYTWLIRSNFKVFWWVARHAPKWAHERTSIMPMRHNLSMGRHGPLSVSPYHMKRRRPKWG